MALATLAPGRKETSLPKLYAMATQVQQEEEKELQQEQAAGEEQDPELSTILQHIWRDETTLYYIEYRHHHSNATPADKRRAQRRFRQYKYHNGLICRIMPDGTFREVPAERNRLEICQRMHEETGHFGRRRTLHLVLTAYWWANMVSTVNQVCSACPDCDRVKASFSVSSPILYPLPIEGLFYRWGVDLCGPFAATGRGNVYIMICIEHYSKHLELIAMPNKKASTCAAAFRHHIVGHYGSCAEVVTDQVQS